MISVLHLGLVDYKTALDLQYSLVDLRKQGRTGDVLLLLEHPAVITLGRNARATNVLASPADLQRRGVQLFECDRGGDVTYHGPGQLVGYPIFDLRAFTDEQGNRKTLGAVEYVRRLEEVLIRTCADMGIPTERIAGLTGVWTLREKLPRTDRDAEAAQRKIAAIGVHISRAVTSHGFALNVNTDLEHFKLIVPCGISDRGVTSMADELRAHGDLKPEQKISLDEVAHAVSRNFGRVFKRQTLWLDSLEVLLNSVAPAPQDVPMKPPAELRRVHGDEEIFLA